MKKSTSTSPAVTNAAQSRKTVENKDNLDSRKNEEQLFKGDDVTHNEKKTKEDHLKKKEK